MHSQSLLSLLEPFVQQQLQLVQHVVTRFRVGVQLHVASILAVLDVHAGLLDVHFVPFSVLVLLLSVLVFTVLVFIVFIIITVFIIIIIFVVVITVLVIFIIIIIIVAVLVVSRLVIVVTVLIVSITIITIRSIGSFISVVSVVSIRSTVSVVAFRSIITVVSVVSISTGTVVSIVATAISSVSAAGSVTVSTVSAVGIVTVVAMAISAVTVATVMAASVSATSVSTSSVSAVAVVAVVSSSVSASSVSASAVSASAVSASTIASSAVTAISSSSLSASALPALLVLREFLELVDHSLVRLIDLGVEVVKSVKDLLEDLLLLLEVAEHLVHVLVHHAAVPDHLVHGLVDIHGVPADLLEHGSLLVTQFLDQLLLELVHLLLDIGTFLIRLSLGSHVAFAALLAPTLAQVLELALVQPDLGFEDTQLLGQVLELVILLQPGGQVQLGLLLVQHLHVVHDLGVHVFLLLGVRLPLVHLLQEVIDFVESLFEEVDDLLLLLLSHDLVSGSLLAFQEVCPDQAHCQHYQQQLSNLHALFIIISSSLQYILQMIQFILMVNKQGQTRLAQHYTFLKTKERVTLEGELIRKCLSRQESQCLFFNHLEYKIIYRRYASLYLIMAVDQEDENELAYLEFIHNLVETLDKYFENVCELDIMYNIEKAHYILDEMLMCGSIIETNKNIILAPVQTLDKVASL